ncbi:MAG: aspartate-semialdehyde dehydrogenase [Planctomycetota bacterium]|nr:aspartate-semialdehyde dehydrogenase [Planctomycetota bacterium]
MEDMSGNGKAVAVVGATGAVGAEVLACLEKRRFPVRSIRLLASARSKGKRLKFRGEEIEVEECTPESFRGIEIAFMAAGASQSKQFAPAAVAAGAVVVDKSSAFRMAEDVPLVVPEINPQDVKGHKGIVSSPNCSTIIMVVPLYPIYRVYGVERVVVATYQAASGAGAQAMKELEEQTREVLAGKPPQPKVFKYPIAFNLFSHDSKIGPDGMNDEERKLIEETRKIFHDSSIRIIGTCVRVPVFRSHTEAIAVECRRAADPDKVRDLLAGSPGIRIVDDREANHFPMPIETSGGDDVLVGRIRRDPSVPDGRGLAMLVCGDQLLKGAAQNAVQIAELL